MSTTLSIFAFEVHELVSLSATWSGSLTHRHIDTRSTSEWLIDRSLSICERIRGDAIEDRPMNGHKMHADSIVANNFIDLLKGIEARHSSRRQMARTSVKQNKAIINLFDA